MATLTVKTVEEISTSAVRQAMNKLGIKANLELEAGKGAQYDFAELTDDEGNTVWSTDNPGASKARQLFDEVWS